jgi:hypothetical protein
MTSLTHTRLGPSRHGIAQGSTEHSHQRLVEAYHTALRVPFDDHTPFAKPQHDALGLMAVMLSRLRSTPEAEGRSGLRRSISTCGRGMLRQASA